MNFEKIEPDGYEIYQPIPEHDESSIGKLFMVITLVALIAYLMQLGLHIIH